MGKIVYYSNYCNNSKSLLSILSKTDLVKKIHFICIDKRINKNGKTYIILDNNQEVLLPETINSVPALLLLDNNYKIYYGEQILQYLQPMEKKAVNIATNNQGEPECFNYMGGKINDIVSDCYSYLDQDIDDLSAKGNGGLRQTHNYATLDNNDKINTPPEDYVGEKLGEDNLKKLENERNSLLTN